MEMKIRNFFNFIDFSRDTRDLSPYIFFLMKKWKPKCDFSNNFFAGAIPYNSHAFWKTQKNYLILWNISFLHKFKMKICFNFCFIFFFHMIYFYSNTFQIEFSRMYWKKYFLMHFHGLSIKMDSMLHSPCDISKNWPSFRGFL